MCGTCTTTCLGAVHIEYLTTGTFHEAAARLAGTLARRLKSFASIPQCIFSRSLRSLREKHLPCAFEVGAGLVERGSGAALAFAGTRFRMKAAAPFSCLGIMRIACPDRDRAGAHVTIVGVPALFAGISRSAAGEGGHVP
jgi:hypothetical protein